MHRRTHRLVVALAVLVAAGCSGAKGPGTAAARSSGRTIDIDMVDNAFRPAEIIVAKGESVTLRFTNKGAVAHEAFVGDARTQADHEAQMAAGMSHHGHDHGAMSQEGLNSVRLQPGSSATIVHVFGERGRAEIACHEPGHYSAGMKIAVTVA